LSRDRLAKECPKITWKVSLTSKLSNRTQNLQKLVFSKVFLQYSKQDMFLRLRQLLRERLGK